MNKAKPWSRDSMIVLLSRLANTAKTKGGRRIISSKRLLDLWEENRIRLLLDHEVSFSLECFDCCGCGSGDGVDTYAQAIADGWTQIEPAPADSATSHFFGRCPEHTEEAKEQGIL